MTPERRITSRVKAVLALALLAVLGFAAAGCGASKKAGPTTFGPTTFGPTTFAGVGLAPGVHSITVRGNTEISNVKAGTWVACKTLPGIRLTAPATGANVTGSSKGREIRLERIPNGSIRVFCPAH
jgi:hypothetical protein